MIARTLPYNLLPKFVASTEVTDFAKSQRDGIVRIIIEPVTEPRTKAQSRHINSHVQQIAEYTGYDFDEAKDLVKELAIASGYPIDYDEKGKARLNRFGRTAGISEALATKEQASMLIEACHRLAAEYGIVLREF